MAKTKAKSSVDTPCIGVCSTGIGDSVCRGCKRYVHEVIGWNTYSEEQKQMIHQRLDHFLTRVVESKLDIVDAKQLQSQLEAQQIKYSSHKSPAVWVYELLRAGASQISDVLDYGLQLKADYQSTSLIALKQVIDDDFFALSQAHYDRYF